MVARRWPPSKSHFPVPPVDWEHAWPRTLGYLPIQVGGAPKAAFAPQGTHYKNKAALRKGPGCKLPGKMNCWMCHCMANNHQSLPLRKGSLWHVCRTAPHASVSGLAILKPFHVPASLVQLCRLHSCTQGAERNGLNALNAALFKLILLLA